MRRYGLTTTQDVVDLALRRLIGPRPSPAELEGIGWDGDLDELRGARETGWT